MKWLCGESDATQWGYLWHQTDACTAACRDLLSVVEVGQTWSKHIQSTTPQGEVPTDSEIQRTETHSRVLICLCVVSPSAVLTSKMACRWAAVPWTRRRARARAWFCRPTTPTASAGSLSCTAPTRTSTCHLRRCPGTHPPPVSCTSNSQPHISHAYTAN